MLRGRIIASLALVAALAFPWLAEAADLTYTVGLLTRVLIFALAATSLNLVLGYGGMVSFGHAAYLGVGAYVVGILSTHVTYDEVLLAWPLSLPGTQNALIVWPLAMVAGAILAAAIGAMSLRTTGLYFIMITLAFAQMVYFFFISLNAYGGDDGLPILQRSSLPALDLGEDVQFFYVVLVVLVVVLSLKGRLVRSRFGMVLMGCRDNERRMRALGFNTTAIKLVAFTISGALAGLAGALLANQTEFVSPAFLTWHRSGELLIMVILGGMGTLYGPLLGAAAFILLDEYLSQWTEHWMIIFGPLLLLVVLTARGGLIGLLRTAR